ncbi:DNA segregation ATPase FtsK/SpoIIIE, S-DNA-T family [Amphibacillus marinus]|uniref:DNA segregation ATPase FtsK/SpoIIIE, S-DNA-T family n=1 Tax=Amphibacillus marinus TaxID=872970 RepID=A0A1H8SZM4_9BACI|nr:DNA translocase FtsK [Amphibacillus marinus]SEO84141.1 DNA segregation ATPase FtsK/SpoIIIE, S-DNA-T family [Amphibacillus marinus]
MWGHFKNKVMNWFNVDDESSQTHYKTNDKINNNSEKIETKMLYQYPKRDSFQFPMPIDQPAQKRERSQPASNNQRRANRAEHVREQEQIASKRPPFRVQEVPSPVHGYQKKIDLDINPINEPAFLRRKEQDTLMVEAERKEIIELKTEPALQEEAILGANPEVEDVQDLPDSQPVLAKETNQFTDTKQTLRTKQEPFNVRMRPSDKYKHQQAMKRREERVSVPVTANPIQTDRFLSLLSTITRVNGEDNQWLEQQAKALIETLAQFNVKARVVNVMQGPSVTRFEIQPESGVKVSKVKNLSDDIKLNMAAKDIRIEAPIPGKHAIGIELPNNKARAVGLKEILSHPTFSEASSPLTVGLGLDISGRSVITDINRMPHGLIAGATGSGKSVCINTILISLLYKATPNDVRLLLIDPKMVELAPYNHIPHLVSPVITDVKAANQALKWAVQEMEQRYQKFVESGTRDIERFNQKMLAQNRPDLKMAYMVIVIDELADLMMMSPQDVEDSICRIAQKARACGMHLLLATQRPSVDVITGLIKANIPTRIAFSVASQVDSRTMLDTNGAERLLGKGDMLFVENGARTPLRVQGAYVSDEEIEQVTAYMRSTGEPDYLFAQEELLEKMDQADSEDDLFAEALAFTVENNSISTSLLQRRFKIGYNRAARLIDDLERHGYISGQNGSKPRTLLVTPDEINQSHSN